MSKTAAVILASAVIWGVVLVVVANALKGTEYSEGVRSTITFGACVHLLLLGAFARKK